MPTSKALKEVLVVDDNSTLRYVLGRLVRLAGFEVVEAATGREAIASVSRSKISAMVLDLKLGDMDGFQVCRELRNSSATQPIPIVMVSSAFYDPKVPDGEFEKAKKKAARLGVELLGRGDALNELGPMLKKLLAD